MPDEREPTDQELHETIVVLPDDADPAFDSVRTYLHDIGQIPLLTEAQVTSLSQRIQAGERAAWEAMVNANLRLVVAIAKRYVRPGVALMDLIQEGNLGLMKAAWRFDWRRGCRFSTYATWWIRQAIARSRADAALIRVPLHVLGQRNRLLRLSHSFQQQHGIPPTVTELEALYNEGLASESHLTARHIEDILVSLPEVTSLEAPLNAEGHTLADTLAADDQAFDTPREIPAGAWHVLTPRERRVLKLRFALGRPDTRAMTLLEVSREFGMSRERIRQIEEVALDKLGHLAHLLRPEWEA